MTDEALEDVYRGLKTFFGKHSFPGFAMAVGRCGEIIYSAAVAMRTWKAIMR
jgi:hypothetical protein